MKPRRRARSAIKMCWRKICAWIINRTTDIECNILAYVFQKINMCLLINDYFYQWPTHFNFLKQCSLYMMCCMLLICSNHSGFWVHISRHETICVSFVIMTRLRFLLVNTHNVKNHTIKLIIKYFPSSIATSFSWKLVSKIPQAHSLCLQISSLLRPSWAHILRTIYLSGIS